MFNTIILNRQRETSQKCIFFNFLIQFFCVHGIILECVNNNWMLFIVILLKRFKQSGKRKNKVDNNELSLIKMKETR
jgi:hypothetical protein